jgi:hypothetical protein
MSSREREGRYFNIDNCTNSHTAGTKVTGYVDIYRKGTQDLTSHLVTKVLKSN